jgi:hypothetical protein
MAKEWIAVLRVIEPDHARVDGPRVARGPFRKSLPSLRHAAISTSAASRSPQRQFPLCSTHTDFARKYEIFRKANTTPSRKTVSNSKAAVFKKLPYIGGGKKAREQFAAFNPLVYSFSSERRLRKEIKHNECLWCSNAQDLLKVAVGDQKWQIDEDAVCVDEVN